MNGAVHLRPVDGLPDRTGSNSSQIDHTLIADALRANPSVWHVVYGVPQSYAAQIKLGTNTAYRPGGAFQAAVRNELVHARYVGPVEQ